MNEITDALPTIGRPISTIVSVQVKVSPGTMVSRIEAGGLG
jgi:hypothetical protein